MIIQDGLSEEEGVYFQEVCKRVQELRRQLKEELREELREELLKDKQNGSGETGSTSPMKSRVSSLEAFVPGNDVSTQTEPETSDASTQTGSE
jgi:hypothetical protein